jgi:hypothetical protein
VGEALVGGGVHAEKRADRLPMVGYAGKHQVRVVEAVLDNQGNAIIRCATTVGWKALLFIVLFLPFQLRILSKRNLH